MVDTLVKNREMYFPGVSHPDEFLRAMANKTVKAPIPKKTGDGAWPASFVVKIDKAEDVPKKISKLKNIHSNEYLQDAFEARNSKWTKLKVELRDIYIQGGGNKISFGFVKRLRYVSLEPISETMDVPSDSDSENVDSFNVFQFASMRIGDLMNTGQYRNASLSKNNGQRVIVTLYGGGTINTMFGVDNVTQRPESLNVTLSLCEEDYKKLSMIHDEMLNTVISRRDVYFPNNMHSDDFLKVLAIPTVHPPKSKKTGGGFWPASVVVKIDKKEDVKKRKSKMKNIMTNTYLEDAFEARGYSWTKLRIELKSLYFQGGEKGSFGISKRLRFVGLQPRANEVEVLSSSDDEDAESSTFLFRWLVRAEAAALESLESFFFFSFAFGFVIFDAGER